MTKEAAGDEAAGLLGCRPVSETSSARPLRTPRSARQAPLLSQAKNSPRRPTPPKAREAL